MGDAVAEVVGEDAAVAAGAVVERIVERVVTVKQSVRKKLRRAAGAGPSSSGWPTARASSPSASTTTVDRRNLANQVEVGRNAGWDHGRLRQVDQRRLGERARLVAGRRRDAYEYVL